MQTSDNKDPDHTPRLENRQRQKAPTKNQTPTNQISTSGHRQIRHQQIRHQQESDTHQNGADDGGLLVSQWQWANE